MLGEADDLDNSDAGLETGDLTDAGSDALDAKVGSYVPPADSPSATYGLDPGAVPIGNTDVATLASGASAAGSVASAVSSGDYSSAIAPLSTVAHSAGVSPADLQTALGNSGAAALAQTVQQAGTNAQVLNAEQLIGTALRNGPTAAAVNSAWGGLVQTTADMDATAAANLKKSTAAVAGIFAAVAALGGGPAVAAMGAAFALLGQMRPAEAGPGVCGTNPPPSSNWALLKAWPYYTSWVDNEKQITCTNGNTLNYNSTAPGPAGSFEAYANRVLEYNYDLINNCYITASTPSPLLLAQLIAGWNTTHLGPTRVVTRKIPSQYLGEDFDCTGYDPIARALFDTLAGTQNWPSTVSFAINSGPEKATGLAAALAIAKKAAVVGAIVGGTAAAGIGVWALVQGIGYTAALKSVFGGVIATVNPLPALASEAFHRDKTTVQSLIFPRPKFSAPRAKAWARAHGYHAEKAHMTPDSVRVRQADPDLFKKTSFRTISLGSSGVRAVIGKRKKS
jgi:hypothetical protein